MNENELSIVLFSGFRFCFWLVVSSHSLVLLFTITITSIWRYCVDWGEAAGSGGSSCVLDTRPRSVTLGKSNPASVAAAAAAAATVQHEWLLRCCKCRNGEKRSTVTT